MEQAYLLGIDIGTSSVKTVLTDTCGHRLAEYCCCYNTIQPQPGFVEQDPDQTWWTGACQGIRACLEQSGISPAGIAGICASGMVPNLCPLDAQGRPVRPAILYRDNRAVVQTSRLRARFGWNFSLQDVTPKLLWLKEHEPEAYGRIEQVLNAHSYIAYRLTGRYSSDHDIAAIFGEVYDDQTHAWLPERMEAIGLDPKVLPPLYWPTDIVGTVTSQAAQETGLAQGTPVVAGTGDSYTILLGTGTVAANEGLIYLGTAGTLLGLRDSLDHMRGTCPFITGGAQFLGNVLTGGEITRWCKDALLSGTLDYAALEQAAAAVPAGAEGLYALPHLLGERTPTPDPLARGVLFGLTTAHTAGHVYRALLEGVAYALRDSYEHAPLPLTRLVIGGGGSRCALWRQIIADVLGRPLTSVPNGDNALGTAYLAGVALGIFDSFNTVRDQWLNTGTIITPDREQSDQYDTYFHFYQQLNTLVRPAYQALAALK
ncbi:MAG: hypothetical protein HFE97_08500 [Oscillospiraceae bacterium]|nr:hypothetical protein [Oscillospiraceae bacterium]